jgi:hypothetical protein
MSEHEALLAAVADAVHAPSIFNTQPWQWALRPTSLELFADLSRRLAVVDPGGGLLRLSCGAALHHARVSLAAAGWAVEVDRRDDDRPLLAHVEIVGPVEPDPHAVALREAIPRRRTDRRPFADEPVPADVLAALVDAAQAEGVGLHRVRLDQMPMLAVAAAAASATELASPRYRIELIQWTNRPEWSHDGVPPETAVRHAPRRVPVRDFAVPCAMLASGADQVGPESGLPVPAGGDRGAAYLILHGPGERRLDWLRAGEALSAVLLLAVRHGLAVAPFSDVLEVDHSRGLVRGLLPGPTQPYIVIRCGYQGSDEPTPDAPRRGVDEVLREAVDSP